MAMSQVYGARSQIVLAMSQVYGAMSQIVLAMSHDQVEMQGRSGKEPGLIGNGLLDQKKLGNEPCGVRGEQA